MYATPERRIHSLMAAALRYLSLSLVTVLVLAPVAQARIDISASDSLPGFKPKVSDYVVSCPGPITIRVRTPGGTEARIGDRRWFGGSDSRTVQLTEGQAIKVAKRSHGNKRLDPYYFRCLPGDFPTYDFSREGTPRSSLYVFTPGFSAEGDSNQYIVIFDDYGTPIWWHKADTLPLDGKVLSDGSIAFALYYGGAFGADPRSAFEIIRPNGNLVREMQAVGTLTDFHDLQEDEDGNYYILSYKPRGEPIDTTAYNGDASANVIDAVVQKTGPGGELLWEWNSKDHIGLAETGRWWNAVDEPYDIVHINAVDPVPGSDDVLISLRHADAVYRIDGPTGDVVWKLGGTTTPESLAILDDPHGANPLGGPHDVRSLTDTIVTVHDNRTDLGQPRSAMYVINLDAGTATLADSQTDPDFPTSVCCGSARFSNGAWLMSWGGTSGVAEYYQGERTFKLTLGDGFSYRAVPSYGNTDKRALRRGMNAQVPLKQ